MSNSTVYYDDTKHQIIMTAWSPEGIWSNVLYGIMGGMYVTGILPSVFAYPFLLIGQICIAIY